MFCYKCGSKLIDGAQFCHVCGALTPSMGENNQPIGNSQASPSVPPVQQYAPPAATPTPQYTPPAAPVSQRQYYAPGTHPYHRLGGFLMAIVVINYISGVISLIDAVISLFSCGCVVGEIGDYFGGLKACVIFAMVGGAILMAVSGMVSITYAGMIRSKDSNVLHFMQSASVTMFVVSFTYYLIIYFWVKSYDRYGVVSTGSVIGNLIWIAVTWIIGLIVASVYFSSSVRVRIYMGSDDYLRKSVFNKGSISPIPADGSDQPNAVNEAPQQTFDPQKQWVCSKCYRVNSNYVTTCICGNPKPKETDAKAWLCQSCGYVNSGCVRKCVSCGALKVDETFWVCPNCGAQNSESSTTCTVCYAKKASAPANTPGRSDWQCPQCKKTHSGYVTTCTCGCPSSMGIRLNTYTDGAAPKPVRKPQANEWLCPKCGRINANYVGTCGCGTQKP